MCGACAVMIGNEGAGLAAEWMEMCDARVTIPCPGPVESLNAAVAGVLLLYEASRQRARSEGPEMRKEQAGRVDVSYASHPSLRLQWMGHPSDGGWMRRV